MESALSAVALAVAALFLLAVYVLPTIIAARRHVRDVGMIGVLNVCLGWTVIGWVVALALAMRDR